MHWLHTGAPAMLGPGHTPAIRPVFAVVCTGRGVVHLKTPCDSPACRCRDFVRGAPAAMVEGVFCLMGQARLIVAHPRSFKDRPTDFGSINWHPEVGVQTQLDVRARRRPPQDAPNVRPPTLPAFLRPGPRLADPQQASALELRPWFDHYRETPKSLDLLQMLTTPTSGLSSFVNGTSFRPDHVVQGFHWFQ